jgi:hypothetical protein
MVGYEDTQTLCFKDTVQAYRRVRQTGGLHITAFMAALDAYNKYESDAKNGNRQVQDFIAFAASIDPKNFWDGVYHDQWATNR